MMKNERLMQNRFKNASKQLSNKNMDFDTKGFPKGNRNRCQNSLEINVKTGNGKIKKSINTNVSLNGKNIEIHCENKCF